MRVLLDALNTRRGSRRIAEHIANLSHTDSNVACRAEGYLVRYYGVRALAPLIEACGHADAPVRYRAAWALGSIGDPAAFDVLLRLTNDPAPEVRYDAAWALGKLGDLRAVEPLLGLLRAHDPEDAADGGAAQGLAELGEPAVPALLEALNDPQVCGTAAAILGGIGDERAIEPLARLLTHPDDWTRVRAVEALAEMGEHTAHSFCSELIAGCRDDDSASVRKVASYWFGELNKAA